MNETHVTVVGNLVADPVLRVTPGEREVAGFRLASTVRRYDAELGRSVDVRTSFYSVSCWGYLARNAAESLRKGERVVVTGRLDVREYSGDDKVLRTSVDVVADAVGHDLTYGTSRFTKVRRGVAATADGPRTPRRPRRTVPTACSTRRRRRSDRRSPTRSSRPTGCGSAATACPRRCRRRCDGPSPCGGGCRARRPIRSAPGAAPSVEPWRSSSTPCTRRVRPTGTSSSSTTSP